MANILKFHPHLNLGCWSIRIPYGSVPCQERRRETAACTYFYRTNSTYNQREFKSISHLQFLFHWDEWYVHAIRDAWINFVIINATSLTCHCLLYFMLLPTFIVRLLIIFLIWSIKTKRAIAFMKHRRRRVLQIVSFRTPACSCSSTIHILTILLKQSKNIVRALLILSSSPQHSWVILLLRNLALKDWVHLKLEILSRVS